MTKAQQAQAEQAQLDAAALLEHIPHDVVHWDECLQVLRDHRGLRRMVRARWTRAIEAAGGCITGSHMARLREPSKPLELVDLKPAQRDIEYAEILKAAQEEQAKQSAALGIPASMIFPPPTPPKPGLTGRMYSLDDHPGIRVLVRKTDTLHVHVRMTGGTTKVLSRSKWRTFIKSYTEITDG